MAELIVAFAPEDRAQGEKIIAALAAGGRAARPLAAGETPSLLLWSRHAARRRMGRGAPGVLIARLDATPPPRGVKAYRAADLRAWRGGVRQPAFKSLLRMLAPAPKAEVVAVVETVEAVVGPPPAPRGRTSGFFTVAAVMALIAAALWWIETRGVSLP